MTNANSTYTYEVTGDITHERATQVFEAIDMTVIDPDDIVVNLARVEESDSAALAVMLEWANQAYKNQKTISFINVPGQLMRLIELTHLDKILKLVSAT